MLIVRYMKFYSTSVLQFTEAQLEEFALLNKDGVKEMYEELKKENVADYNRRVHQAEVLKMDAKRLSENWSIDESLKAAMKKDTILKKLNESELVEEFTEKGVLQGFGTFACGACSQKGYYPANPTKENQDSFDIRVADDTQNHFFGVFDGHGEDGGRCSQLCKATLGDIYEEQLSEGNTTKVSISKAHTDTHVIMTKSAAINAELSGSTSVIACLKGSLLTIAYAGDSAAIIGSKSNRRTPVFLTDPHDLRRPDEVTRIERKGGLIMSTEEYDEIKGHMTKKSSSSLARSISNKPLDSLHSMHSLHSLAESAPEVDPASTSCSHSIVNGKQAQSGSDQSGSDKSMKPRSRRPILKDSTHFHQSLSDLLKFSEPPSSKSSLQSDTLDTTDHSLNQSLRKVINLASTHSSISLVHNDDESYVPRIWSGTSVEKVPGVAFTRSLGDIVAHGIGVSEKPEFKQLSVQDDDVIVIASDGVTECKLCRYSMIFGDITMS